MKIIYIFALLLLAFNFIQSKLFPHIIWVYWDSGIQKLGGFQKLCYLRMVKLHQNTDWKVNFIEDKLLPTILNQKNYKSFKTAVQNLGKKFYPPTKSDLVRFYLLKEHGGVWLDISIILKQNLNWMDDLLNNPRVFNKGSVKNPEAFLNIQHKNQFSQEVSIQMNSQKYYPLVQMQSSVFAAVKQSKFITDIITQFQKLILEGQQGFNISKQNLYIPYKYSAYYVAFRGCSVAQYKKYAQYREALSKNKSIQNLEKHFYNYLAINKMAGMYHGSLKQYILAQFMLSQEGLFGDYQTQMMKLPKRPRNFLIDILSNNPKNIYDWQKKIDSKTYQFGQQYLYAQYENFYKYKIHENSAVNKYLLQNKTLAKQLFPNAIIIKDSQIPLICKITTLKTMMWSYPMFALWIKITIILIIASEFIYHYSIFSFSFCYNYFKTDFPHLRYIISNSLIYLTAIYLQKDLIWSQYSLWIQHSPTAIFVCSIQICFTLIIIKWFFNIIFCKNMKENYQSRLMTLLLLQFYFLYSNSVWKFKGQVYNYEILAPLNKIAIYQGIFQLIKMGIVFFLFQVFQKLRYLFNINIFFNEKQQQESQKQFILNSSALNKNQNVNEYQRINLGLQKSEFQDL